MIPPKACTLAEVPLITANSFWSHDPSRQRRYPSWPAAVSETSGRFRIRGTGVEGIPATPDCHDGFAKSVLTPRLPAARLGLVQPLDPVAQLSFQTSSGM